jgi:hypothetical protein
MSSEEEGWDDRIAVCGYSLSLPGGINTGQDLVDVIKEKRQLRRDVVETKRYPASIVDEEGATNNPWKLKARYSNLFTEEEGMSFAVVFMLICI